jgi:Na+-translocating ferredoxin:NAD+ oxidoreductase subunit B
MTEDWANLAMGALALTALTLAGGALLSFAVRAFRVDGNPLIESIDAVLPQTQCGQCGHPGCRPYAEAIANGEAINRCPPGGQETVDRLAELLGVDTLPLDADPETTDVDRVAVIIEEDCIGCTKCIQACPVDAILGAAKLMHTVLPDLCTGCDLCIAPCPVDCIEMVPRTPAADGWTPNVPSVICSDRNPSVEVAHG